MSCVGLNQVLEHESLRDPAQNGMSCSLRCLAKLEIEPACPYNRANRQWAVSSDESSGQGAELVGYGSRDSAVSTDARIPAEIVTSF